MSYSGNAVVEPDPWRIYLRDLDCRVLWPDPRGFVCLSLDTAFGEVWRAYAGGYHHARELLGEYMRQELGKKTQLQTKHWVTNERIAELLANASPARTEE